MNDYESTVSREGWESSVSGRKPKGGILATIHLNDDTIIEREFFHATVTGIAAKYLDQDNNAKDQLRIWLDHTKWIESGPNEFLPMSAVEKVTWTEIPQEPS